MEVDSHAAAPFRTLLESLPSRTILNPLKSNATPQPDEPDSPTMEIPNLPKNAYGLESFGDYCAAVKRVKVGLPAIEAVTPPDCNEPLLIHGTQFKYWNPDQPESDDSETESETTTLHLDEPENDRRKSTWSAGTPRRSILRQSTSSPILRDAHTPLPILGPTSLGPTSLVYDYASTASPGSRCTSRLSSRRISIEAGVQSEHTNLQNNDEEVVRTAAMKRASGRRSSVGPVRRGSFVHGLAGFTGIGRTESGAVICTANGKKFELVVDKYDRNDERERAVQCSALEIDSEIEAMFSKSQEDEVIDVDSLPETMQAGNQTSEEPTTENKDQEETPPQINEREEVLQHGDVPSPEQLRSANPALMTPRTSNIPDLSDIAGPSMRDTDKTMPGIITPTHLSLKSDAQDNTCEDITNDEIVAVSAHGSNRLSIHPKASEPAEVSTTPELSDVQPTGKRLEVKEPADVSTTPRPSDVQSTGNLVESKESTDVPTTRRSSDVQPTGNIIEGKEPADVPTTPRPLDVQPTGNLIEDESKRDTTEHALDVQLSDAPPAQPEIHCIGDPAKTLAQNTALAIARQRSLSLKPSSELVAVAVTREYFDKAAEVRSLCLGSVRGLDIRPTASAYQLAAMATLSPKSYLRAIQPPPPQPRVVFAFASPGGTAPVRGIDVAPPALLSTPPVATLAVAPSSTKRASLIAAPRRSHVSIPRTGLSTPSQGLLPINSSNSGPREDNTSAQVNLESEVLVTPAPLQHNALISEARPMDSKRTHSGVQGRSTSRGPSQAHLEDSKVPSDSGLTEDVEEHPVDFTDDDDDDDFGAPLDMDDDVMMEAGDIDVERECAEKTEVVEIEADKVQTPAEVKPESVKSRSRKTSVASSRARASRRTQQSSVSVQKRTSSVTQVIKEPDEVSSDVGFAIDDVPEPETVEAEREEEEEYEAPKRKRSRKATSTKQTRKGGQKTTKRTGQKRWRELKSLPTSQVKTNDLEEGGPRRSKRQRFPRLKFWKNETVSYERRLSQAIPTIAEVIVEVGGASESDDDTWFGRR